MAPTNAAFEAAGNIPDDRLADILNYHILMMGSAEPTSRKLLQSISELPLEKQVSCNEGLGNSVFQTVGNCEQIRRGYAAEHAMSMPRNRGNALWH